VTAEGKRSKLESEPSSASLASTGGVESMERGMSSKSTLNVAASMQRVSGSSPPSTGAFSFQPGLRRPSSSSSPALYSETVNSPIKVDPNSPRGSSPALSAGYFSRDARPSARSGSGDPRQTGHSIHSQFGPGSSFQSTNYSGLEGHHRGLPQCQLWFIMTQQSHLIAQALYHLC